MRALIYTRGQGVSMQEQRCRKYAEEKGYEVVSVISGEKDISKIIVNSEFDVLLVSDMSRLTRSYGRFLTIEKVLALQGVKIESTVKVGPTEKIVLTDEVIKRILRKSFQRLDQIKKGRETE